MQGRRDFATSGEPGQATTDADARPPAADGVGWAQPMSRSERGSEGPKRKLGRPARPTDNRRREEGRKGEEASKVRNAIMEAASKTFNETHAALLRLWLFLSSLKQL